MQVALAQAREARLHILAKMQEALPHFKTELSDFAPRLITLKINPEKIRDVIGKGGATIRALTEETGTQIDINDYLKEGQIVKVKVIQTDEKGRVRLSAKALLNEGGAPIEPIQPTQQ